MRPVEFVHMAGMPEGLPIAPAPRGVSVLGIISLVLGLFGLPFSVIPCVNFLGLPFVGSGLLLGVIGISVAKFGQKSGIGLPIAGSIVSFVGLAISVTWIGVMAYWVKDVEDKRAEEEKEIREGSAIVITAVELGDHYDRNQLGADQKYKGQVLEVSGAVERVAQDAIDKIIVELKTDEGGDTIDCNFTKDHREELARLVPARRSPSGAGAKESTWGV